MSESVENTVVETPIVADPVAHFGAVFQEAREKAKLSLEDVSSRLRLSIKQIKALETNDFSALPEAMITRGFIRNYARFLEIDAEPLLEVYRVQVPSGLPRAISLHSENILISGKDKSHWQPYILASLFIAFLLAAWMIYFTYFPQEDSKTVKHVVVNAESETTTQQAVEPLPEPALPAAERDNEIQTEIPMSNGISPTAKPAEATPAKTATDANTSKLKLSISQDTWVSVVDKDNKEIFNKNKPAGSEDEVEGQPPFKVVIGNAAGAKLVFNGKPVDLAPYTKLNIAKLTLE